MSKYFEVANDNGRVLLDDNTFFVAKTRSGNLSTIGVFVNANSYKYNADFEAYPTNTLVRALSTYDINLNENEYSIAIQPTLQDNNYMFVSSHISPTKVRVWCMSLNASSVSQDYINSLKVYVFGKSNSANSNTGIQIYNAGGNLIYQTTNEMINIQGEYDTLLTDSNLGSDNKFYYAQNPTQYYLASASADVTAVSMETFGSWFCYRGTNQSAQLSSTGYALWGCSNNSNALCLRLGIFNAFSDMPFTPCKKISWTYINTSNLTV